MNMSSEHRCTLCPSRVVVDAPTKHPRAVILFGKFGRAPIRRAAGEAIKTAHREKVLRYVLRVQNWQFHALMGGMSPRFVGGH
jgi:hypothetical protein